MTRVKAAATNIDEKRHCLPERRFNQQVDTIIDLKTLVDNIPIAIILVGRDGSVLLSNQMVRNIHRVDRRKDGVGRFGDVIGCPNAHENDAGCGFSQACRFCRIKAMIEKAFAVKECIAPFEINIGAHSADVRSFRMSVTYIRVEEWMKAEREMCIVSVEDLTELKKKERLAAASETIGAICHEMNQPLQAIMGDVELLKKFQLEKGAISKIEKIFIEMDRIKRISTRLMNLARYQTKPYLSTNILDVEKAAG